MECWFAVFGPPVQLISDQEQSMVSHEAGRELERFQIERVPKGSTSGQAGKQNTGTGLVERHIGLLELTMKKVAAELDRQGIAIQPHELSRECAMSHNMSLNYGGATPSMAVFRSVAQAVLPGRRQRHHGAGRCPPDRHHTLRACTEDKTNCVVDGADGCRRG